MALVAQYADGAFQTSASSTSLANSKTSNSSGMDSDAFLQLLVAEMQNQDPLEPTTNTEWVSQYATFTQVSEIQSIGDSMGSMSAQGLVGQHVIMKVTDSTGNTDYVSGKVDYVVYEEGKAYLSINDSLYSIDDLDTVASDEYMEAYELATSVAEKMKKLPSLENLTLGERSALEEITAITSNMNSYQKTFLDQSVFDMIDSYEKKMKELIASVETDKSTTDGEDNSTEANS